MKWWQKPPRRHLLNRLQSTICHYRPRRWCSVSTGTRKNFLHHHHHWQQWIKHFHQQHPFMSCQLNVSKSLKELEVQLNWGNQHCFQQMMQVTGFCTSSSTLSFLAISLRCWILQYQDLWAPEVYMGSMNPMMQGWDSVSKEPFSGHYMLLLNVWVWSMLAEWAFESIIHTSDSHASFVLKLILSSSGRNSLELSEMEIRSAPTDKTIQKSEKYELLGNAHSGQVGCSLPTLLSFHLQFSLSPHMHVTMTGCNLCIPVFSCK